MPETCLNTATPPAPPRDQTRERPEHDARTLTGLRGEATIDLDGTQYTLRITRQNKLILTK